MLTMEIRHMVTLFLHVVEERLNLKAVSLQEKYTKVILKGELK